MRIGLGIAATLFLDRLGDLRLAADRGVAVRWIGRRLVTLRHPLGDGRAIQAQAFLNLAHADALPLIGLADVRGIALHGHRGRAIDHAKELIQAAVADATLTARVVGVDDFHGVLLSRAPGWRPASIGHGVAVPLMTAANGTCLRSNTRSQFAALAYWVAVGLRFWLLLPFQLKPAGCRM
ncbi:hypothetical protein D3C78_637470 [compost metagenome]